MEMTSPLPSLQPKAQHYVPCFYLKGFTDNDHVLWVCEKGKPIRKSKPKDEANRPDYYTHVASATRDETAEEFLESSESRAAPMILKLANPQFCLTPEKARDLYLFVAFMFARVPSIREYHDVLAATVAKEFQKRQAQDKQRFHEMYDRFRKATGEFLETDAEALRQIILAGQYDVIQSSTAFNLDTMFDSAFAVLQVIANFSYEVLYAPSGSFFVTSDAPVVTILPDGSGKQVNVNVGFGWPDVEVFFPLNKRACMRLKRGIEPGAIEINDRGVTQINRVVMACASRHLFSSQGHKRIARLFDEYGCTVRPGKESFLPGPIPEPRDTT